MKKKKKDIETATGRTDAAEHDEIDHDSEHEDPIYRLRRSNMLKTKSSVSDAKQDGQKTGEKKKDTEKARGEADAAEQDGLKMKKKKKDIETATGRTDAAEHDEIDHDSEHEDPIYLLRRSNMLKTKSSVSDAKQDGQKTGKKKKDT